MRSESGEQTGWTLSSVSSGETVAFRAVQGGRDFLGRLASLGFTPGVRLRVIQNQGRGPMLVILRGTRVALGRGEAARILVEPPPGGADDS